MAAVTCNRRTRRFAQSSAYASINRYLHPALDALIRSVVHVVHEDMPSGDLERSRISAQSRRPLIRIPVQQRVVTRSRTSTLPPRLRQHELSLPVFLTHDVREGLAWLWRPLPLA